MGLLNYKQDLINAEIRRLHYGTPSVVEHLDKLISTLPENHNKAETSFNLGLVAYQELVSHLGYRAEHYKGYKIYIVG